MTIPVGDVAREQFVGALGTNEIRDESNDLAPVSDSLVALVDQQLPEKPRADDLWRSVGRSPNSASRTRPARCRRTPLETMDSPPDIPRRSSVILRLS